MKTWKNRLGILFMAGSVLGHQNNLDGGNFIGLLTFVIGAIFFVVEWEA